MTIQPLPISDDYRSRVAAEVAARYGVLCKPEAVQVVPRGASYFLDLLSSAANADAKLDTSRGHALRRQSEAKWSAKARKKRLDAARAKEENLVGVEAEPNVRRQRVSVGQDDPRIVAARARLESVRSFIGEGRTLHEIAAFMGISRDGAYSYVRSHGLPFIPARGGSRKGMKSGRFDPFPELAEMCKTMTAAQIAVVAGVSPKAIYARLRVRGLSPVPGPRGGPKPISNPETIRSRQEAKQDRIDAVVRLVAEGHSTDQIAAAMRLDPRTVAKYRKAAGCSWRPDMRDRRSAETLSKVHAKRDARDAQIRDLRIKGMKIDSIAAELSCAVATVSASLLRLGLTGAGNPTGLLSNPAVVDKAVALASSGNSLRRIADALGVTRSSASRIVQFGLKQRAA